MLDLIAVLIHAAAFFIVIKLLGGIRTRTAWAALIASCAYGLVSCLLVAAVGPVLIGGFSVALGSLAGLLVVLSAPAAYFSIHFFTAIGVLVVSHRKMPDLTIERLATAIRAGALLGGFAALMCSVVEGW